MSTQIIALVMFAMLQTSNIPTSELPTNDRESFINSLLDRMTVREKVGQMTQIDLNILLKGGYANHDGTIDPDRLALAINHYKIGSILNVTNNAYDLQTWHKLIAQIQDAALRNETPIPVIYGIDAIHGASYISNSTLFPHNINMAATRNPDLVMEVSRITAMETRASGVRWNFDPVLDLGRNPLWPRFEETFGEDPYLTGVLATAAVRGYEGNDISEPTSVASTIKHFLGYSNPRTGRDRTPAHIPELELRELDLTPYYDAIKAGASTVMINSGEVNGIPVHANRYLLTDVLRGELGFDGVIVSDWEDVNRIHERHNIAPTLKEAVRIAVMAGIDISMTPHDFRFAELLSELYIEDSDVAEMVDASVRRILRLKHDVGLFDNAYPEPEAAANFGHESYRQVALEAARESITLARNHQNILPLDRSDKILLAGPCHDHLPSLHGSWSYTWQGARADVYPESTLTIRQMLEISIGSDKLISMGSTDYHDESNYDVSRLIELSRSADKIILCLGEDAYAESPGSIQDLSLDHRQIKLVLGALSTGKPVITMIWSGRPRIISAFAEQVDAVLLGYRASSMGARAMVEILYGDVNPSGKLPFTYPRHSGDIVLYDHKWTEANVEQVVGSFTNTGYNPQFPFGHGLSYTLFDYSEFRSDRTTMGPNDTLRLSVKVTNIGKRSGHEVVELYSRQMYSSVVPSLRKLRKFKKIFLDPGETKEVEFLVTGADIAYVRYGDHPGQFIKGVEDGEIRFMIGGIGFDVPVHESGRTFVSMPYIGSIAVEYRN